MSDLEKRQSQNDKRESENELAAANPLVTEPEYLASGDAPGGATLPVKGGRAAAIFIFFTVALDMLSVGMIVPVLPRLIESFMHNNTASAAQMLGVFGTVWALMQFSCSPILGSLSDRFGRRPVVLLSNVGLGLDYLLMGWAPALGWLFVGRVISGITSSSIPTAMAYVSDVTPHEKRAAAFGMLNAAFGIGFVVGPAVGGLLGSVNPRLPFWVAGCLSLVNACYGLFVLPESLGKEHRSAFSWKRANPIGAVALLRRHASLLGLAALLLFGYIAQQSLMNVYVIYADYRYHWTDRTVGLSLATVGVFTALYGAFLVKPAIKALGERGAILAGLVLGACGYSLFGISKTGVLFWCAIPLLNFMSVVWPSAQSLMSRQTGVSEQGQLQGAINSLRGIAGLIGPGLFTYIFSKSIGADAVVRLPGMPFYVAAAMLLVSWVIAERVTRGREMRASPA